MSERVLILGGTREAAELATTLVENGVDVITSLAGRTKQPRPLAGETRTGGFGGASKMAEWVIQNGITEIIDATHPFAFQISRNAQEAAKIANIPIEVKTRLPWKKVEGDNWTEVSSLHSAAEAVPARSRVFLALGSQHLAVFESCKNVHFVLRMIDQPPTPPNFKNCDIVIAHPSSDWRSEAELLQSHNISHIVCRNSGGQGAYAKLQAARHLSIPVIIVQAPK